MTNEEMAIRIQQGEKNIIPELWTQVEKFVRYMAYKLMRRLPSSDVVELDDLCQSGYLAFLDAVERFDEAKGTTFITILSLTLKTAFADACGYRSKKQQLDPIHHAESLDEPLAGEDDYIVSDTIADPTDPYEGVEERIFRQQLHEVIERVLGALEPSHGAVIRGIFYENKSLSDIAAERGETREAVRTAEGAALKELRQPRVARRLREYIEQRTPYYLRVSGERFNSTGSSAVEEIVLIRERIVSRRSEDARNETSA